jgi:succinyl-CoA synthetase beta subunit
MTELSVSAIGHHLDFVVRMKGPNRTRGKGIVIEDA